MQTRKSAFTLVELLVVIAVIAVLVLLLLPAINAARESARSSGCKNNIRQLGLAMNLHESARGRFPAGWEVDDPSEPDGAPGWAWGFRLLPFLEEDALYRSTFDQSAPVDDLANRQGCKTVVGPFLCPSDPTAELVLLTEGHGHDHSHDDEETDEEDEHDHAPLFEVARSNFAGVYGISEVHDAPLNGEGVLFLNSRITQRDITDGLSKTVMLGERSSKLGSSVWVGVVEGAAANMERVVGSADHVPNSPAHHFDDFSSHHPTGAHFVTVDGAVRLISDDIDPAVYQALATRRGGETASFLDE
ncbi:MAG: DUF1559 domain-containing protein [Planctomycetales bacterium]|nr:DUF1559 domain-containing protein [Planctomycetales bacterium]